MYCPRCGGEFRPGFTFCARCEVALVQTPPAAPEVQDRGLEPRVIPEGVVVDYCGFLDLQEARWARQRLRDAGVFSEIVIREAAGESSDAPAHEEYWIRVAGADLSRVDAILSPEDPGEGRAAPANLCPSCGGALNLEESFCPHCGERFGG